MDEIRTWEDLYNIPRFDKGPIDVEVMKTGTLVNPYRFAHSEGMNPCGLHCRRRHFSGYVVALPDGRSSNVGHICGRKFGDRWRQMKADLTKRTRAASKTVSLEKVRKAATAALTLQHSLSDISKREADAMLRAFRSLPERVKRKLESMATSRDGQLFAMRPPSEIEIARAIAAKKEPQSVRDRVGVLEGLFALVDTNRLDVVLDRIELRRGALERMIREEKSTADQISAVMEAFRKSLDEPIKSAVELRRFFAPENIAKLRHLEFGRSWPYRHASLANDYSIKLVE